MELVLRLFGIGEGDEVITTAYTYSASCSAICHVGATPVLVDTAKDSFEIDYDALEKAINSKTKAIIPVDVGGVMCDYKKVLNIVAQKQKIFCVNSKNKWQEILKRVLILADAAHSFGSVRDGFISGSYADFSCFSFHAVKNLTTAEGGAITWKSLGTSNDEEIYKYFMLLSLHGQSKDALEKTKLGSWEYDIKFPGFKCNMTDIMAAIGLVQLQRYSSLLEKRQKIIHMYEDAFKELDVSTLKHNDKNFKSCGHLYCVRLNGKDESFRNSIIEKMAEHSIATNVHYKPLPMHTAYKNMGFDIKDFPNAYDVYHNEITLPLHTLLSKDQVEYIINTFKRSILA
jgi:dTDP-4-amino-4,6-dideoxygalactose transaminase